MQFAKVVFHAPNDYDNWVNAFFLASSILELDYDVIPFFAKKGI